MSKSEYDLSQLGWGNFFQQQQSLEEWELTTLARVAGVNRKFLSLVSAQGLLQTTIPGDWYSGEPVTLPTVGDWLLVDNATRRPVRLLGRKSFLQRKAAGRESKMQAIAANIDTLFIVTSCNEDFNPSRIERYLTLTLGSGVIPVLVINKSDLARDVEDYVVQAKAIRRDMEICPVNALDPDSVGSLHCWCGKGQTIALAGSSGVGKSTLVNTLSGANLQLTRGIRANDAKGRHTTTERSLHLLPTGTVLIDTPGLRELQLADCHEGLASTFDDIERLARSCRFRDCTHGEEPGCAVQAAICSGALERRRLANYQKLLREQERNTQTLAERRDRDKQFCKMCRDVMATKRNRRKGY